MRRKIIKVITTFTVLVTIFGSIAVNAKQPYCIDDVATAAPMSDLTDEAAAVPTEVPTAEPTAEPVQEAEITPDPLAPLYWQQEAARQEQAEANGTTHSLLGDIKGLLGGLFGRQDNTNTPAGNTGGNSNAGSNSNSSGSSNNSTNNGAVNASGNTASSQDAQMAEMFAALFENMELITPEPTQEPKKTATDGNGYIIEDKQMLDNGKEFLTMSSKDGTEFYMVIDRNKDNEVYMLNKFDNTDLEAFIEASPSPAPTATPKPGPTATPLPEPEKEKKEKSGVSGGTMLIMILIAAAIAAGIYFFRNGKEDEGEETEVTNTDDEEEVNEDEEPYAENSFSDDEEVNEDE